MSKIWMYIVIIAVVLLIFIQFLPVRQDNPPVRAEINAPPEVQEILERSCYNCHSNETNWPFYAYVAPVSWLVAYDVHTARLHMNFSEWENYPEEEKAELAEHIWEMTESDAMPLNHYLWLHWDGPVSDEEKQTLKEWHESFPSGLEGTEESQSDVEEDGHEDHQH